MEQSGRFTDYHEILTALLPYLNNNSVVIIDDACIEDQSDNPHPFILKKEDMLRPIDLAGIALADQITADEESFEEYEEEFDLLVKRCNELINKYPDKTSLFQNYIDSQRKEYTTMETEIVCSIMLLKRK